MKLAGFALTVKLAEERSHHITNSCNSLRFWHHWRVVSESSSAAANRRDQERWALLAVASASPVKEEVYAMWHWPIRITLEVKRNRTSWQLIVRIQLAY